MSATKIFTQFFCIITISLLAVSFTHAEAIVRLKCKGDAVDAMVFINGQAHSKCPVTIFVKPGDYKIRVVKAVDAEYERVYEQEFSLADDGVKSLRVKLSSPRLSEKAQKARAQEALKKAREGDIAAMKQVSTFYEQGSGVAKSTEKSEYWSSRARDKQDEDAAKAVLTRAEAGDIDAMSELAILYQQGKGVNKSSSEAQRWQQKREQTIADKEAVVARRTLTQADRGDVSAMKKMSEFYASGTGVEKNSDEAKAWDEKAKAAIKMEAQAKADEETNAEQKAKLAEYKNGTVYLQNAKGGVDFFMKGRGPEDASLMLTVSPTITLFGAIGLVSDTLTSPFHITEQVRLQKELNARAAVWGKPNSMVAKAAYKQGTVQ